MNTETTYAYIRQTKQKRFRWYVRPPEGGLFADGDYATRKEARKRLLDVYPQAQIITKREFLRMTTS